MQVVGVHRDGAHRFTKATVGAIELVEGLGVLGDAHYGETVQHRSRVRRDPSQPNLRQVHLLHAELLDELSAVGHDVGPGLLGENVTTSGVDLLDLPTGTLLRLGRQAEVVLTGLRNPCRQIDRCRPGVLREVLRRLPAGEVERRAGVMGVVRRGGPVCAGDAIEVVLPPGPHRRPLEPV